MSDEERPMPPTVPAAVPAPASSWWRSNRVALGLVVILLPAVIAFTFTNEWGAYWSQRSSEGVAASAQSGADFGEAHWKLDGTRRIPNRSAQGLAIGLPAGTDLVVATIAVDPASVDAEGLSTFCTVRLAELDGGRTSREWKQTGYTTGYRPPEGIEYSCVRELSTAYRFDAAFVVPADAGDDLELRLDVADELPRYLAFRL